MDSIRHSIRFNVLKCLQAYNYIMNDKKYYIVLKIKYDCMKRAKIYVAIPVCENERKLAVKFIQEIMCVQYSFMDDGTEIVSITLTTIKPADYFANSLDRLYQEEYRKYISNHSTEIF